MSYYDFVSIDFETATNLYSSACAIGIAAVQNGEITDTFYSLLRPHGLTFLPENIEVHGITPEMVAESPTMDDVWEHIYHFFGSNLIVAHNAYFDMSVLNQSLIYDEIQDFKYVDSVAIAKDFVPGSKSLEHCAAHLSIEMGHHHNALDDAITCAKVVLSCLKMSRFENIGQLCFAMPNVKIHNFSELKANESYRASKKAIAQKYAHVKSKDFVPQTTSINENNPLFGKYIVFTGEMKIGRADAMQMAVDAGAILKTSVSSKVNYLVVGEQDATLVGPGGLSTKQKKANELNTSGKAEIKVIGEVEFLDLLHLDEVTADV